MLVVMRCDGARQAEISRPVRKRDRRLTRSSVPSKLVRCGLTLQDFVSFQCTWKFFIFIFFTTFPERRVIARHRRSRDKSRLQDTAHQPRSLNVGPRGCHQPSNKCDCTERRLHTRLWHTVPTPGLPFRSALMASTHGWPRPFVQLSPEDIASEVTMIRIESYVCSVLCGISGTREHV